MTWQRLLRTFLGATLTVVLWGIFRPDNFVYSLVLALVGFGVAYGLVALFLGSVEPAQAQPDSVVSLLGEGRVAEAQLLTEQMRRQDPADVAGWAYGAQIELRLGGRDEAEKLVKIALELDPDHPVAQQVQDDLADLARS